MPRSGRPPCGWIGTLTTRKAGFIDPASDDLPSSATGSMRYSNLVAARKELRKAIARANETDSADVALSKEAAGLIYVALDDYAGRKATLEHQAAELERRIATAKRTYAAADGDRATGKKERALRRLFDEPEPCKGRVYDVRQIAEDFVRLRHGEGEVTLCEICARAQPTRAWIVPDCPKDRRTALDCVIWWHEGQSRKATAKLLRNFAHLPHGLLERADGLVELLKADFPQRK